MRCLLISSILACNSLVKLDFWFSKAITNYYFSPTSLFSKSSSMFFSDKIRSNTICKEAILSDSSYSISFKSDSFSFHIYSNFFCKLSFKYFYSFSIDSNNSVFSFFSCSNFLFNASFLWFTSFNCLFNDFSKKFCSSSSYASISMRSLVISNNLRLK